MEGYTYLRKIHYIWRCIMNEEQFKGNWMQLKGKVQKKWGKLTDNDLTTIKGNRNLLVGKIIERYGIAKEEAEKQLDEL